MAERGALHSVLHTQSPGRMPRSSFGAFLSIRQTRLSDRIKSHWEGKSFILTVTKPNLKDSKCHINGIRVLQKHARILLSLKVKDRLSASWVWPLATFDEDRQLTAKGRGSLSGCSLANAHRWAVTSPGMCSPHAKLQAS